jgi:hypothetical protein
MRTALALTVFLAAGVAQAESRGAYVLCSNGSPGCRILISSQTSVRTIKAVRSRYGSASFLWVRIDGREYVIRDRAFLDRADVLFAPVHALEPEQAKVSQEERALDHEEERLEKLAGDDETRVRDRMREIERKLRDVEAREKRLDDREEELERVAENDLWRMVDDAIRSGVAVPPGR